MCFAIEWGGGGVLFLSTCVSSAIVVAGFISPCAWSGARLCVPRTIFVCSGGACFILKSPPSPELFNPFTSFAGCSRTPYLWHKNKLYPLSASHPDNAIIRGKEAITNETAMFVYILPAACECTAQFIRLGTNPECCRIAHIPGPMWSRGSFGRRDTRVAEFGCMLPLIYWFDAVW
jgi:hypothetical protein